MAEQVPSVGRVVHFVNGDKHVPAFITDPEFTIMNDGEPWLVAQALTVFPVNEPPFTTIAALDETAKAGTWHWPEYVPAKE